MLAPGITYDPDRHPAESAPLGGRQPITTPDAGLRRRYAQDRTPYCACCDDTLRPHVGRGRPKATCTNCGNDRRASSRETSEQRQRDHQEADKRLLEPYMNLTNGDVESLIELVDEITTAVGRASSHFTARHRGTWQHALLLASKDLVLWREQHLPYGTHPPSTSRDSGRA